MTMFLSRALCNNGFIVALFALSSPETFVVFFFILWFEFLADPDTKRRRAETFSNTSRTRETKVTGKDGNTTVTKEAESSSSSQQEQASANQGQGSWLEGMNSPLIQQEGDCKQLKLRFDVSQYKPEEIVVKTVDNKLLVHAKHEEKSDSRSVYREYNREFLLPKGTNPELIKSSLSKDGVLTVEAPLPAIADGEKVIPIAQN
ncbi:alpha-crystallin B chain-like isoform X1 [Macrobrachium nipponense]|uniref:alpha-crystallin B chain-like isoform X1 n=1 Tax=Macrobrachium nipponense TaxID=159736 RepID=UPI0030C81550